MTFSDCNEVGGQTYALLLYALAESVRARSVLEVGAGWGHSGVAFAQSLKNRLPGTLVSIDTNPARVRKDCAETIGNSGVVWDFVVTPSKDALMDGRFDLIYIDGDPNEAANDFKRFKPLLNSGGLIIIDGYNGQPGPTDAADNAGLPFVSLSYSKTFSFAVFRDPKALNQTGRYSASCEECPQAAILPSWVSIDDWADRHVTRSLHNVMVVAGPRNLKYRKGPRN